MSCIDLYMTFPLDYSYASSLLRVTPVAMGEGIAISIVVTSNEKDTVSIGFTREDSNQLALGYKNAAKITKSTIQALWDLLGTKNSMISSLKSNNINIKMNIVASKQSAVKRTRMYKALIDKNIAIFDDSKEINYSHDKTIVTNDGIVIFIQRQKSI